MSKLRTRLFVNLRRLGEYELLRKIGSGGMAEVWMGRRAAMAGASKVVAIKLLARNVLDDPAYRQMFLEEARLSMLLTNSNVVQVFDVGESGDECYMVMEWVDGLNLSELRRKMSHGGEQMSTVAATHVIGEILRALAYAHGLHHDGSKATIVHRDVSPQNVLVSVSGEVKLADFGVARLAHEETSGLHVKGKLRYMAPEQLRGRSRAPTVDLYAVGAILHELLSGERFRSTRDEADLYSMVLSGEYDQLPSDLPDTLVQLTYGLLEPDPGKRIPSADLALELLHSWPGYRNSSLELSRVVQRWLGVSGPRSGFLSSEMIAAANSAAETRPADTRPRPSSPPSTSPPKSGPSSSPAAAASASSGPEDAASELDTAVEEVTEREVDEGEQPELGPSAARNAETHTFVEAADATTVLPETEADLDVASEAPPPRSDRMSMMLVAGATVAISFGVFGIGFPLGWWGGGGSEGPTGSTTVIVNTSGGTETGAPPLDLPAASETAALGDETSTTGGETGAGLDDAGGSETGGSETGEGETGEGETGETGMERVETGDEGGTTGGKIKTKTTTKKKQIKQKKQKQARKPVEVTFNVGNFTFVYVRVGRSGKELPLEPNKTTKVMSGKHTVYLREFNDKAWTKAGTIKLEPGRSYRVEMREPNSLRLIEK